nr:hypothetical protein [uncultured Fluviicola sp.]
MNPSEQAIKAIEESMLGTGKTTIPSYSQPSQTTTPEKTAVGKSGAPDSKSYDNSTTYAVNLVLPSKQDPNDPDAALTDEQKKKRQLYIMGGILAAIIILIIALSMRKK